LVLVVGGGEVGGEEGAGREREHDTVRTVLFWACGGTIKGQYIFQN
jgi:hypothetical protein